MSSGICESAAFLASSNLHGLTDIETTLMPSDLANSTVLSVDPVSAIRR